MYHRRYVGPEQNYDITSALQFNLLTSLGLREHNFLLDIGCGSLRAGRLFIVYLQAGHYYGIEPNKWLLEDSLEKEIGHELVDLKKPLFNHNSDFKSESFNQKFDFVLAHSIFSHASQEQIRRCLEETRNVMKRSSVFVTTFVEGDTNYKGDKWVYPNIVTYTIPFMEGLVHDVGLDCHIIDWPHPRRQSWLLIYHELDKHLDTTGAMRILNLERDLAFCSQHLNRLKSHPLVRVGFRVKAVFRRLHLI